MGVGRPPKGTCGDSGAGGAGGGGGNPPPGSSTGSGGSSPPIEVVCSSSRHWMMGENNPSPGGGKLDKKGPWMNPGLACIACHQNAGDDGPIVRLGGTVYPTLHEPDLCYGVDGATTTAHVVVSDANGQTFTLPIQRTGNFSLPIGAGNVVFPITAKVVANGAERKMFTPQMTGDCNGCHTEQGKNGAPGRIYLP
ncbi:Hypothetical protein A7982_06947 [Minicystis rosea]|nr:Hypothetical protein A7982_06947 [Minicystis rosea]